MKLLILSITAWLASQCACAQQIRLSLNNAPFRQLLKSIERQSNYSFIFTKSQVESLPPVTVTAVNRDIFELLNEQLRGQPLGYTVDNHFIILHTKQPAHDSLRILNGRVANAAGEPIASATVQIRNEQVIGTTDQQGYFSLPYTSDNALLQISGAELTTTLVTIHGRQYIEVRLEEQVKELDETIIMAYGTTTRRFNTGNITKVKADQLEKQSTGNLLSALQGRVPGLLITATSGAPGTSFISQVRGQSTVNPNPLINNGIAPLDNPLIIVNGVPFAPQNNNVNQLPSLASPGKLEIYRNPYGGISPLGSFAPADIESIEVLKDADATAIYGSRAANGIVLITTRQARPGEPRLQLNLNTGVNTAAHRPSMLNTAEYLDIRRRAFEMDSIQPGMVPGFNYAPDLLVFDNKKYTDWYKYFFHAAAPFTIAHTRVSGGKKQFNFISSMGYRQESYLLKGDFENKLFSLHNSVTYHSINSRLKLEGTTYYSQGINRSISSPLLLQAVNLPPNYPDLLNEEGQLNWQYKNVELEENLAALKEQTYIIKTQNFVNSLRLNYQVFKGLHVLLNGGYSGYQTNETSVFPASATRPSLGKRSYADFAKEKFSTVSMEPLLEFKNKFGRTFITMLSGATIQRNTLLLVNSKGLDYQGDEYLGSLDNADSIETRSASDDHSYQSFFGRIGVQQAGKYMLNLTGRRERSNRLSAKKEWGNFGSLAAGWIFSEEHFIRRSVPFISYGKLRLSYGSTGNDNTGYYHQLNAWPTIPTYSGNRPLIPQSLANADFGWSLTKKTEAGMELRLLKDRLSIEVSRYVHHSTNQLISQLSSSPSGTSRYIANFPAVVQNKGWEIIVGAEIVRSKKVVWNTMMNISLPKNKLREFPDIENSLYSGLNFPGQPLSAVSLTAFRGVDRETGLYDFDPDINIFRDNYPRLYGGLHNTLLYKRMEIELFIEFRKQNGVNYLQQIYNHPQGIYNQPKQIVDHWQYPGDKKTWQRLTANPLSPANITAQNLLRSEASYSDASYVRLRNLSISYSPGKNTTGITGLNRLKIYIQTQNIITLTSFKQSDPELQSFYSYPLQRSFNMGLVIRL